MTSSADELAGLAERNAALRDRVEGLLDQFTRETERLRQARESAAALSVEVVSPDGLVQAKINSAGELADLRISATAFERTRPETLARTIRDLVRRGMAQVKWQQAELMRPFTESMPDLSDLVEGAPSLAALLPRPAEEAIAEVSPAPAPTTTDSDWSADSVLRDDTSAPPMSAPTPVDPARPRPPRPVEDDEMPDSWMLGPEL